VIVLVGFMGAGKSTVGSLLAARLGLPFTDSDQVVEQRAGRPVRQIFAEDGEPAFRALEHQVIAEVLDGPARVLALGGGAAEHPGTRDKLASAQVVYLQVSYEQALQRVGGDGGRPLLARPDLAALYQRRLGVYAEVAMLTVPTDGRRPEDVAEDILARTATLLLNVAERPVKVIQKRLTSMGRPARASGRCTAADANRRGHLNNLNF
jgi:shikimate kinase